MTRGTMTALACTCALTHARAAAGDDYLWARERPNTRTITSAVRTPRGFRRVTVQEGSFADWLRNLPLKAPGVPVRLHDGSEKPNQQAHVAVIDIDTGHRDLQQCADAVIRLRAEYLYARGRHAAIHFNFTSGDEAAFGQWAAGYRPVVSGNNVSWAKRAGTDSSYPNFRKYLTTVFIYAGSHSLSRELKTRPDPAALQAGDVFIQGGFPGHAVLVVDMAQNTETGEKVFLLAQSYMPAQDIHVLKNPNDGGLSPWYRLPANGSLRTPEWTFRAAVPRYFAPTEQAHPRPDRVPAARATRARPAQDNAARRTIHVFVALADNENQGIVPVPAQLGDGTDPANNLYWGALYGVKTFLRKSPDWKLVCTTNAPSSAVLERCVFRHKTGSAVLVADAYHGAKIKDALSDFLTAASGAGSGTVTVDGKPIAIHGAAQLVAYVGHNGLMDVDIPPDAIRPNRAGRAAIVLACSSKPYFGPWLTRLRARPVLLTTGLMAPEAYTLEAALDAWLANASAQQLRKRAAAAYHQYQKCGMRGARRLFWVGE